MNLMGGGLWGVGFVTVDMRIRKLLKRFLATPMRKRDFLLALMLSRLVFTVPEVLVLLAFGWLVFGVRIHGSVRRAGVPDRAGRRVLRGHGAAGGQPGEDDRDGVRADEPGDAADVDAVGRVLLVGAVPGGDAAAHQALPLTALNDALRAVMLEGESLAEQWAELLILGVWGILPFVVAPQDFPLAIGVLDRVPEWRMHFFHSAHTP